MATTSPAGWPRPSRSASGPVLLALLVFGLAGCDPSSGDGAATGRWKIESNAGRYSVEVATTPAAITINEPFDVAVTVTPKSGAAADVEVVVDARMPAHFHGMNRVPKITRGAGNTWKAEGLVFHMSGHWELYVDLTQGGRTERAQLDVDLK